MQSTSIKQKLIVSIATRHDRELIYQSRHRIYAEELGQHTVNKEHRLTDSLDTHNVYIVAKEANQLHGFISITLPGAPQYSVDKYFDRSLLPFTFDDRLYEVRLLSVAQEHRSGFLAFLLMYAAYRFVQTRGGKHLVAICRTDLLNMYRKAGLRPLGPVTVSGAVQYALAITTVTELEKVAEKKSTALQSIKEKVSWQMPCLFREEEPCYHGGSFFKAIGQDLQHLYRRKNIINADVLDAWFPPSPKVTAALQECLPWLLQTSPPTHSEGLIQAIAKARNIANECLLAGAGSSSLIFMGLRHFLHPGSKVLLLDPCYGEYLHVLKNVIGCQVDTFPLRKEEYFQVDMQALSKKVAKGYDCLILVNPNSPTGVHIPKKEMEHFLLHLPKNTLIWIDETYIDYVSSAQSLEIIATQMDNVVICKSLSKVLALSGARVAYLCASPAIIHALKRFTPPWSVSLPAQLAAITALQDRAYYQMKYEETRRLRQGLTADLNSIGMENVLEGCANFLLFYLPEEARPVDAFLQSCQEYNLFLRDVSNMGVEMGRGAVRIAVKDEKTNLKMVQIMKQVLHPSSETYMPVQSNLQ